MNSNLVTILAVGGILLSTQVYSADDSNGGVINFSGAITDTTCTINGGKNDSFTVALNPISVSDAGTTVGIIPKNKKSFSLTLSDCSGAATQTMPLKIYFSSVNNISPDGKYLKNTTIDENDTALARNVGFSLASSGSTTPILLNQPYNTSLKGDQVSPNSETIIFDVYYYKTNASVAKVGELSSSLTYTISYL